MSKLPHFSLLKRDIRLGCTAIPTRIVDKHTMAKGYFTIGKFDAALDTVLMLADEVLTKS
jgi:hypothetical protein